MLENKLVKSGLLGSASALGYNWIYDRELLVERSKTHKMIFDPIDHKLYKKAKTSFDVYPNHKVGDLDFMGEVFYLFHMFFFYEKDLTIERWRANFYNYFREDFEYDGYIESFGKDFLKKYKEELDGEKEETYNTDHLDKQLVGLLFILALYENGRSQDKVNDALLYARTLTSYKNIKPLTEMLYKLLQLLDSGKPKTEALKEVIKLSPLEYKERLEKAITMDDTNLFISEYAGVACGLEQSLPLIFHIVNKVDNWEDALVLNATLGGASSARGIYISALLSKTSKTTAPFDTFLNYNIK